MKIGIDASRAFLKDRTGIEEYAYRVIEHLRDQLPEETRVTLYIRQTISNKRQEKRSDPQPTTRNPQRDLGEYKREKIGTLDLPKNWEVKEIGWRRFWTQGGLSWELFWRPVDVLFVPAHTVPFIHPKKTVVVMHGLEYEFCPRAYSLWERWYMRVTIWLSCWWASTVIAVSKNTKKDLVRFYGVPEEKVVVIYEGRPTTNDLRLMTGCKNSEFPISNFDSNQNDRITQFLKKETAENVLDLKIQSLRIDSKFKIQNSKFILFIGRIEERKNVVRIIEAFEILKEKYKIPHKLILAGKDGYGSKHSKFKIQNSKFRNDIVSFGYVGEEQKAELLKRANILLFPSLYEGFGLPILEAQMMGVPVVTSNISSMPEVVRGSAVLVDPYDSYSIAEGIYSILSDEKKRDQLISSGIQNVQRFSWEKCAREIGQVLAQ